MALTMVTDAERNFRRSPKRVLTPHIMRIKERMSTFHGVIFVAITVIGKIIGEEDLRVDSITRLQMGTSRDSDCN